MIVLGIDPGIARCGWGVVEKLPGNKIRTHEFGCIETRAQMREEMRLHTIYTRLSEIIHAHDPDVFAVEKVFFAKNTKTALSVAQARGAILVAAGSCSLPVASYTPLEIKMALTGYGQADKRQVERMVMDALKLVTKPKLDDTADALAVALTHVYMKKFNEYSKESA